MMNLMNFLIKLIGINQCIGGIAGIVVILIGISRNFADMLQDPSFFVQAGLIMLCFLMAILAGYWLFKGTKKGLYGSCLIQILQIPSFITASYGYTMGMGFSLFLKMFFQKNGFIWNCWFYFPIQFSAQFGDYNQPTTLSINIVALFSFLCLCLWGRKIVKREKAGRVSIN